MLGPEVTIPHKVNELFRIFGISNARELEGKLSEYLVLNREQFIPTSTQTHTNRVAVTQNAPIESAHKFTEKYEELKSRNVRDLDAVVQFLHELDKNKEVKKALSTISIKQNTTLDSTKRLLVDSIMLDQSSTSSNTGSGQTRYFSQQQLAGMKDMLLANKLNPSVVSSTVSKVLSTASSKSSLKLINHTIPDFPNWCKERAHLSWDFYPNPEKFEADFEINKLNLPLQEEMIIEDLLNCMTGIEGKYIKTPSLIDKNSDRSFHIDRSLDPAMRDLAKRILPICSHYSLIVRFIEEKSNYKYGLVNHALCAAIRETIRNHYVFVCQLETIHRQNGLSLQKLWYYVSSILNFMELIALIIKNLNKSDARGSRILDELYEKILQYSGEPKLQELVYYLAQMASKPFLNMLDNWIHKGIVKDPYEEFMVVEKKEQSLHACKADILSDQYWENRYILRSQNTPIFLKELQEKILLTGKYLNAINVSVKLQESKDRKQKNMSIKQYEARLENQEILFSMKMDHFKEFVDKAYDYSNRLLLDLLLNEFKLIARLKSLKHYFLLDQSDFMVHFMDISEEEMSKSIFEIKANKLESLLELSLRITSANSDPYKDDLRVKLFPFDLKTFLDTILTIGTQNESSVNKSDDKLKGFDCFSLDYVVKWPLSLIINEITLQKYQLLFRHIFFIKHVERKLLNVWLCTKSGLLYAQRSSKFYSHACALKQRMLNFIQNLLNYMTFEVFEANWSSFDNSLSNVSNIDDLVSRHTRFLDSCLQDCILATSSFNYLYNICSSCIMFVDYVERLTEGTQSKEIEILSQLSEFGKRERCARKQAIKEVSDDLNKLICDDHFGITIATLDKRFSQALIELLAKIMNEMSDNLGQSNKIGNIVHRLDLSDHYREQIEKLRQAKVLQKREQIQKHKNELSKCLNTLLVKF